MRVEVSAATRHTVEDLLAGGGDGEGGDGEGEGQVQVRRASAWFFFRGRTDETAGTVEVPLVFFDAEGVRSGRSRAGKGRRARPVAAADDAERRATRRFSATASRRAFVASRDARREVRRITRLAIGRQSRLGAVATERALPETKKRTLCAPGLGRLHLAGGPAGSGGTGGTTRGQLRVAKPRHAAAHDRCGDVGIVR